MDQIWLLLLILTHRCQAAIYHEVAIDQTRLKNFRANGSLVEFLKENTVSIRKEVGSQWISGKQLGLEKLLKLKFAFQPLNELFYASPELHIPKCAQMVYPTFWLGQECQLPPSCGITTQHLVQNGWFSSEVACLSMFTDQQPNSTVTNFQVKHDKNWGKAYNIVLPRTIKNMITMFAISDMIMMKYQDDTFQLMPKIVLHTLAIWDKDMMRATPMANSQQGKFICYHVPDKQYPVYYARANTVEAAIAASGLILDQSDQCPLGFTFINIKTQVCTTHLENGDCFIRCEPQQIFECDTKIDNFSPPGYLQRAFLATAMWIWDLFSHSVIVIYTRLFHAIVALWRYLNIYMMVNEYIIIFLVATIILKNIYSALAVVVLLITITGIYRY